MNWLAVSNPWKFLRALISAKGDSRLDDAHLRMKAKGMAKDYQALFGGLAKEFHVTLVAGSIVLPDPSVIDGTLKIGRGALFNSSVVFGRDGLPIGQPQRQMHPVFDDNDVIEANDQHTLNVVDTPAGRLGVLIGSDSWYPDNYRKLDDQGAQLVAVPAYVSGHGTWDKPWRGYKGLLTPTSVSLKAGELSEGQAWHRLTLTAQPSGDRRHERVPERTVLGSGQRRPKLSQQQRTAICRRQRTWCTSAESLVVDNETAADASR
jgi:hypothetical protein